MLVLVNWNLFVRHTGWKIARVSVEGPMPPMSHACLAVVSCWSGLWGPHPHEFSVVRVCVCVCVCRFLGKKQTNALRMVLLNGLLWKCFRRMLYIWCRVHCLCVCVDSDGDHFGLVHLGWNCYYSILCGVRCTRTARSSSFDGGGHRIRANVIIFV